jgi:hypothetical protein
MQIHEVFGLGSTIAGAKATAGAMLKDPKSLVSPSRFAQAQQVGAAASAAKSAAKLQKQGFGGAEIKSSPNQLISQVQQDSAAQQLVNTWAAQWPKLAANVPAATAPASGAAPAPATTPPLTFDGRRLDANDPVDARIIAQLRAQKKITEQQTTAPDPDAYRAAFVSWADGVVERTIRQTGVMQQLKNNPNWAQQFAQAESEVVNTVNDSQRNSQAVKAYLTLAVAAARAAQQNDGAAPAGRSTSTSGINDPAGAALARTLGIDATDLTKLNAYIRRQGETVNPKGTGSESLDALLRAARLLR